ncbi:MAG TPA: hypothetical protein VLM79_07025 [Kofleriaceae bacterium]|nr:hypothetical protein [Kofleriaceae bacterium]
MSGRTTKLALASGFVVLLAMMIGLAQLTSGTPAPVPTAPAAAARPAPTPVIAAAEPVAPSVPQSAAREVRAGPTPPRAASSPTKQPELPFVLPSFRREFKRDANGKLVPVISIYDLRDMLPHADAAMKACIERAGKGATGKATLNFTVGAKNNKLLVETTGVQDEETLAGFPDMLDCMHKTATLLLPPDRPVPELGSGIYVRRHVVVQDGALVEDWLFDFSYNP